MVPPRVRIALAIGVVGAIAAAVCGTVALPELDVPFAILLAFYLPGAAWLEGGRLLPAVRLQGERIWWSVVASTGTALLGGLLLNVTGGLTRTSWAAFLGSITATGTVFAVIRPRLPGEMERRPRSIRRGPSGYSQRWLWLIPVLLLLAGAIGLSVYSSRTSDQERFAQLWLVPTPLPAGDYANHMTVGIENQEGRTDTFRVVVETGQGKTLETRRVRLASGARWTLKLSRPKGAAVEATLALASSPSRVLDTVRLAKPV